MTILQKTQAHSTAEHSASAGARWCHWASCCVHRPLALFCLPPYHPIDEVCCPRWATLVRASSFMLKLLVVTFIAAASLLVAHAGATGSSRPSRCRCRGNGTGHSGAPEQQDCRSAAWCEGADRYLASRTPCSCSCIQLAGFLAFWQEVDDPGSSIVAGTAFASPWTVNASLALVAADPFGG